MATTLAEINVIPLVDVMLVLLIIFMVTAPMLQRGVELKLPQMSRTQEISSERLFVDVPLSLRNDQKVFLGKGVGEPGVSRQRLRQQLGTRRTNRCSSGSIAGCSSRSRFDVFDQLKAAGIENVGLATEPPPIR